MADSESLSVLNNEAESRFEVEVDGKLSVVEYELTPGKILLTHTGVAPELSGRGIAQQLVTAALEYARSRKLRVVPLCSYVAAFIERHPEYKNLVV
ncbi:MAG: GNAT family N-acetyltransferase [Thermoanaerobaculia bacterium]